MQTGRQWKKCLLICSLIFILISIDCRTRLEQSTQVLFVFHELVSQSTSDAGGTGQIMKSECGNLLLAPVQMTQQEHFSRLLRNCYRNNANAKCSLFLGAVIIALLEAISRQKCREIHIHDTWYIRHRYYHIIYIQDEDGSKSQAMLEERREY